MFRRIYAHYHITRATICFICRFCLLIVEARDPKIAPITLNFFNSTFFCNFRRQICLGHRILYSCISCRHQHIYRRTACRYRLHFRGIKFFHRNRRNVNHRFACRHCGIVHKFCIAVITSIRPIFIEPFCIKNKVVPFSTFCRRKRVRYVITATTGNTKHRLKPSSHVIFKIYPKLNVRVTCVFIALNSMNSLKAHLCPYHIVLNPYNAIFTFKFRKPFCISIGIGIRFRNVVIFYNICSVFSRILYYVNFFCRICFSIIRCFIFHRILTRHHKGNRIVFNSINIPVNDTASIERNSSRYLYCIRWKLRIHNKLRRLHRDRFIAYYLLRNNVSV